MEITFTNVCKDKIVHAKDGIKFALKGYAFYSDQLPIGTSIKDLTIGDLDPEHIVLDEYKEQEGKTKDRLFDMTYIPSLEGTVVETDQQTQAQTMLGQFGTYEIVINKGLFKTLPLTVKSILLFGEEMREESHAVIDENRIFLAGVIPFETLFDENEFVPKKLALQLSFSDFTDIFNC